MLSQPPMDKLTAMQLQGVLEALKTQEQNSAVHERGFLGRLCYWSISMDTPLCTCGRPSYNGN